ncbi:MAG: hypothetical protein ABEK50_17545 [bacterium]
MKLFAMESGEMGVFLVTGAVLLFKYAVLFGGCWFLYQKGVFHTRQPEQEDDSNAG